MNKKGITLIELIIFIIVGGMFIPLAYISFTALTSNLVRPETAAIIKAIAETKMNDINSTAYDSIISSASYSNVTDDTRFQRSSPNPYDGYKWRWEITYITYKDNALRGVDAIETWSKDRTYKVGDYVKATNYLTNNNFYRVYFQERKPNNRYELNELVRLATFDNSYYKSLPPQWQSVKRYNIGDYVRPTSSQLHVYKSVPHDSWSSTKSYSINNLITEKYNTYRVRSCYYGFCIQDFYEPSWPSSGTVWDFFILWEEYTRSGSTEPSWPESGNVDDGGIKWLEDTTLTTNSAAQPTLPYDGSVTWQAISNITSLTPGGSEPIWEPSIPKWQSNTSYSVGYKILSTVNNGHYYTCAIAGTSGNTEPTWPTSEGASVNDGTVKWQEKSTITDNDVSWIRTGAQGGTPYKSVKIYITPPGCSNDSCAYVLTNVVAARDYATRP